MKLTSVLRSRTTAVLGGAAVLALVAGGSGAMAASMVTSKDIKDHTIQARDMATGSADHRVIKNGSVHGNDLTTQLQKKIAKGGKTGPQGPQGPQGPAGPSRTKYVENLNGLFTVRTGDEAGLKMTGDGIQFGPFADGGACANGGTDFARLDFSGLNGVKLSDLKQLDYTGWYVADTDTGGVGSPTMRVFFEGTGTGGDGEADEPNRLTFSPNTQFNKPFNYDDSQGAVHTWMVTHGTVRYNDDGDMSPAGEKSWDYWVSQYPDAKITNINILNGCQAGTNLTSVIRSVQADGTTYQFGN